ncbi:chorismate pyruvate-lyase family protein [Synechococcus sp. H65.1]|uniref:chorismate pyruvate-lyase family protein n=1 Tax=unclassified Synechococcus TaxID=2626047 RepID=UPI0039C0F7DC
MELFPSLSLGHAFGAAPPKSSAGSAEEGFLGNVPSGQAEWWPLRLQWQGEADPLHPELMQVDPVLRLLLLGDGLTTRNLATLTLEPIQAQLLDTAQVELLAEQSTVPKSMPQLAKDLARLGSPLMRRRVCLWGAASQRPLLYATSWWNPAHLAQYLPHPDLPIGQNLIQEKLETFRELGRLYYGEAEPIARLLNCPGPFWARHYLLLHRGQPLTVIYEVFSSRLGAKVLPG